VPATNDDVVELAARLFDDRDIEVFLRSEVREQAALGELGLLGEPTDREPGDADHARELERSSEDHLAGLFSLRHLYEIKRPC